MRAFCMILLLAGIAGCAGPVSREVQSQLAPTGTLRVGLNLSTTLLAIQDPATGEMRGVAIDVARDLARRIGVPVRFVGYATGQLDKTIGSGEWDVAFFAIEPARAQKVTFSPPYAEIEATYLVREDSPIRSAKDVDRGDITVAVTSGAGYESMLARLLKHARLLRTRGFADSIKQLNDMKVDAVAGLKPDLLAYAGKQPDFRVVDGKFFAVEQAIGIQKGMEAADRYLRSYIAELKQSGFLAKSITDNKAAGLAIPQ